MKKIYYLILPAFLLQFTVNAQNKTIAEIQGGVNTSPLQGQIVTTTGVVTGYATYKHPTDTAKDNRGYFIQNGDSAWSGIWVKDSVNHLSVQGGDTVTITATVHEYYQYTRLDNVTSFVKGGSGPQAVPIILSTFEVGNEKYEGVLVEVNNAIVNDITSVQYGEFTVNDGSGDIRIDDFMYWIQPNPKIGDRYQLRGCMYYSYGKRYLYPRKPSDVTYFVSVGKELNQKAGYSFYPNPSSDVLTIELNEEVSNGIISIYNMSGSLIINETLKSNVTKFDVSEMKEGIYLVSINNNGHYYSSRVIVK